MDTPACMFEVCTCTHTHFYIFTSLFKQKPEMRQHYMKLKELNQHLLRQLESGQQELDQLNSRIEGLQEVSNHSHAFVLYLVNYLCIYYL